MSDFGFSNSESANPVSGNSSAFNIQGGGGKSLMYVTLAVVFGVVLVVGIWLAKRK